MAVVNNNASYTFKGEEMTVGEALKWYVEAHTDPETGEGPSEDEAAGWLICAGARRQMALAKDNARYAKGKVAERIYAPRVKGTKAPKTAERSVDLFKTRIVSILGREVKAPRKRRAS